MRPRTFSDAELLATARRCFLEHGAAVSTATIAAEIGVSQAALFKRYPTKRALMLAALRPPQKPDFATKLAGGPGPEPAREQLAQLIQQMDAFLREMMPSIAVLHSAGFGPKEFADAFDVPPPVAAHAAISAWLEGLHASGRAHVADPKSTALALMGTLHARRMLEMVLGPKAPQPGPDYLEHVTDLIWRSIAPKEPAQ